MRIVSFLIAVISTCSWSTESQADQPKGTVVKLDNLSSTTPADWKSEKPKNRLRQYQFSVPGAKDTKSGEVFVFPNLTNTVEANFERYKGMFEPPEGKAVDNIAKIEKFEVGKAKVAVIDIEGTWNYREAPLDPKSKTETRPNSRVISVIFTTDDGNYLIRLSGPSATVGQHAKGFMDWIKGFK